MPHPFLNQQDKAWPNDILFYTDATTDTGQEIEVLPYHRTVLITLSDGTNAATATINLPSATMMKGLSLLIEAIDCAGGITVYTQNATVGDETPGWTDLALDENADRVILYSDGERWTVVYTNLS